MCTPGNRAGVIRTLSRDTQLVIPQGAVGRIVNQAPSQVRTPVGYGDELYELAPVDGGDILPGAAASAAGSAADNVFPSAHAGRYWHRSAPGEPPMIEAGQVITKGEPIGLIEVMKTFGRVLYEPTAGLPEKARVVRVLAGDGSEVSLGDPLIEIEPA